MRSTARSDAARGWLSVHSHMTQPLEGCQLVSLVWQTPPANVRVRHAPLEGALLQLSLHAMNARAGIAAQPRTSCISSK